MILAYYRPNTVEEACNLLKSPGEKRVPLGGGTYLLSQYIRDDFAVIDLQDCGLDFLELSGSRLKVGAMVKLQSLIEYQDIPPAIKQAVVQQAPLNLRNMAMLGGVVASDDGYSPLLTVLHAMDVKIRLSEGDILPIGELLPLRDELLDKTLITELELSLDVKTSYQSVSRTPLDRPIVCVALARWKSGRVRISLGGYGQLPVLAMDGADDAGVPIAARNAFYEAGDNLASAVYRRHVASILARRALREIEA